MAEDDSDDKRGRWEWTRARASEGEGEDKKTETRQDKENKKKDNRGAAGSRVITQSGITHGNEGDEAAVAFYPDLILTRLDQGIYTTTATLCAK